MSLMDTIKGARQEAEEAQSLRLPSKKDAEATDDAAAEAAAAGGFSRRSAARAKPSRELAGTVRTGAKPESEMTKEEKRAAKQERRSEEDLLLDAKQAILNNDDAYRRTQRIWWGLLIVGFVCATASWLIMYYLQQNPVEQLATVSIVLMVLAYVLIIGAFIYDLWKVRPLRNQANEKLTGMSKRRLKQVVAEEQERKAAKKKRA